MIAAEDSFSYLVASIILIDANGIEGIQDNDIDMMFKFILCCDATIANNYAAVFRFKANESFISSQSSLMQSMPCHYYYILNDKKNSSANNNHKKILLSVVRASTQHTTTPNRAHRQDGWIRLISAQIFLSLP